MTTTEAGPKSPLDSETHEALDIASRLSQHGAWFSPTTVKRATMEMPIINGAIENLRSTMEALNGASDHLNYSYSVALSKRNIEDAIGEKRHTELAKEEGFSKFYPGITRGLRESYATGRPLPSHPLEGIGAFSRDITKVITRVIASAEASETTGNRNPKFELARLKLFELGAANIYDHPDGKLGVDFPIVINGKSYLWSHKEGLTKPWLHKDWNASDFVLDTRLIPQPDPAVEIAAEKHDEEYRRSQEERVQREKLLELEAKVIPLRTDRTVERQATLNKQFDEYLEAEKNGKLNRNLRNFAQKYEHEIEYHRLTKQSDTAQQSQKTSLDTRNFITDELNESDPSLLPNVRRGQIHRTNPKSIIPPKFTSANNYPENIELGEKSPETKREIIDAITTGLFDHSLRRSQELAEDPQVLAKNMGALRHYLDRPSQGRAGTFLANLNLGIHQLANLDYDPIKDLQDILDTRAAAIDAGNIKKTKARFLVKGKPMNAAVKLTPSEYQKTLDLIKKAKHIFAGNNLASLALTFGSLIDPEKVHKLQESEEENPLTYSASAKKYAPQLPHDAARIPVPHMYQDREAVEFKFNINNSDAKTNISLTLFPRFFAHYPGFPMLNDQSLEEARDFINRASSTPGNHRGKRYYDDSIDIIEKAKQTLREQSIDIRFQSPNDNPLNISGKYVEITGGDKTVFGFKLITEKHPGKSVFVKAGEKPTLAKSHREVAQTQADLLLLARDLAGLEIKSR